MITPGRSVSAVFGLNAVVLSALLWQGCSRSPELIGYPVNTPFHYSENRIFAVRPLEGADRHTTAMRPIEQMYQIDPASSLRKPNLISHGSPLSVVLQGVRLPGTLPGGRRDIAVVLDIHTSNEAGLTTLVAFYQRAVPPGQMLNFSNLLVYSEPMWDSANPPYFRVRVLDVTAERNRRTEQVLTKVSSLSGEISGLIPHPAIPLVTTAIDAAALVLSNRDNESLLDFQVQLYPLSYVDAAGGADLGVLVAGPVLVMGRPTEAPPDFWRGDFYVDRDTGQIMVAGSSGAEAEPQTFREAHAPYALLALVKADAEVPTLVLERSQTLVGLLSSQAGKSDLDLLDATAANLKSAIDAYTLERRLRRYRSGMDLKALVDRLDSLIEGGATLNNHEMRRLLYVLSAVTPAQLDYTQPDEWVEWYRTRGYQGHFIEDATRPFGIVWSTP